MNLKVLRFLINDHMCVYDSPRFSSNVKLYIFEKIEFNRTLYIQLQWYIKFISSPEINLKQNNPFVVAKNQILILSNFKIHVK